eukprot:767258-Hanusia_phi.AAC.2
MKATPRQRSSSARLSPCPSSSSGWARCGPSLAEECCAEVEDRAGSVRWRSWTATTKSDILPPQGQVRQPSGSRHRSGFSCWPPRSALAFSPSLSSFPLASTAAIELETTSPVLHLVGSACRDVSAEAVLAELPHQLLFYMCKVLIARGYSC